MCERYDAAKVQLISAVPFCDRSFREWFGRRTTRICHADINPAKMAANGVGELSHAFVFRDVERRRDELPPRTGAAPLLQPGSTARRDEHK